MKTITIDFPGGSLNEVRSKFRNQFYGQSWYDNESFAKAKIPAGKWKVCLEQVSGSTSTSREEQEKLLPEGFEIPPAAIMAYAVCEHFDKTGERVFQYDWVRTLEKTSGGGWSVVGDFDEGGLGVGRWSGRRGGRIGCGAARKLGILKTGKLETLDFSDLELRISKIEKILTHHNLV